MRRDEFRAWLPEKMPEVTEVLKEFGREFGRTQVTLHGAQENGYAIIRLDELTLEIRRLADGKRRQVR